MSRTGPSPTSVPSLNRPAATPPPGTIANFQNPPTENALIYGVWVTSLVLTTLAVATRLYSKRFLAREKKLMIEDYLIILAWMTNLAQCIMMVPMADAGMGKPMWDITMGDVIRATNLVEVWSIIYNITAILVKTAILLQILRLFVPSRQLNLPLFIACCAMMVIIFVFYTTMGVFTLIFYVHGQTNSDQQDLSPTTGVEEFVANGQSSIITAIFNAVSDLAILVLPLPSIYRLHISATQKLAVTGLFATGFLACLISVLRAAFSGILDRTTNTSWTMAKEGSFALAELTIAIITFCLPSTPPVFRAARSSISPLITSRFKSVSTVSQSSESDYSTMENRKPFFHGSVREFV